LRELNPRARHVRPATQSIAQNGLGAGRELAWELRYGVVYVAGTTRLDQLPILVPELQADALRDRRLDLALQAVPMKQVGATVGATLVVPEELGEREITARATDITLPQALALILYPEGLTATETEDALALQPLPR